LKVLVDTSTWIDFFNGVSSAARVCLRKLLEAEEEVCISNYILAETLQGFRDNGEFEKAKAHLLNLPILSLTTTELYIGAAQIYRTCRKRGITIRKTADCLIAQTAIEHGVPLLHNDQDFNQIASLGGLQIFPT
jgi:predicted nucleic acid-binding protein